MLNNHSLSIVLPTYNRSVRLKKSLACYLSADYANKIEFIIIDNNSSDDTNEVIEKFSRQFNNIKYIKNPINIGAGKNIFRGFLDVKSEYFMILADDDFITKGFLKEILISIERFPSAGVINHANKVENKQGVYIQTPIVDETKLFVAGIQAVSLTYMISGAIPGIVYKTKLINPDKWLLDNSIYPQIRLSCEIAIKHDVLYLVSNEATLIPRNDSILDILKSRPLDYGVIERIDILIDVSRQLPAQNKDESLNTLSFSLFSWSIDIFQQIYLDDKEHAFKYLISLLQYPFIKSSMLFWVRCIKLILGNHIAFNDKSKLLGYFIVSMCSSLTNKNLYRTILFILNKGYRRISDSMNQIM